MSRPRIRGLLHDHIDGSIVVRDVIVDLYKLAQKRFPFGSLEEWIAFFANPQEDIMARFGTIVDVLQTADALELLGYEYGKRRAQAGYRYLEAKFAPQNHCQGSLTAADATAAMVRGLWMAEEDFNVRIMPQLCIDRASTPEQGLEVARICLDYGGTVSMDLACDEGGHLPEKHAPAFDLTLASPVKRTCHAGEWVNPVPPDTYWPRLLRNVRVAVNRLRVDGLGHAIPLIGDPELTRKVAGEGIRVEGCPAAYVGAGLVNDVQELGIPQLLDAGVCYTLNMDDDLFLPSMEEEVSACENIGLTESHWRQLAENVAQGAFDPKAAKVLNGTGPRE